MLPRPARFYHPGAAQHVAAVTVERALDGEHWTVEVRRGPTKRKLRVAATHGPLDQQQVETVFAEQTAALRQEGYWPAGHLILLERLDSPSAATRARAALRLGWRRVAEAVPKILALLTDAVDESCSLLDALGAIGDPRGIP